jgi:hypothetical protein
MDPAHGNGIGAKGFAGLVDLVSDGQAESLEIHREGASAAAQPKPTAGESRTTAGQPTWWVRFRRSLGVIWYPRHRSTALKVLIIGLIIGAIAVRVLLLPGSTVSPTPVMNPQRTAPPSTSGMPPDISAEVLPPAGTHLVSTPEVEVLPPVGTDVVLTPQQIKYCLAEGIRLDASRKALVRPPNAVVDRFNAAIEDYNSRCSSFHYLGDSVDTEKQAVELMRDDLTRQGQKRARLWTAESSPRHKDTRRITSLPLSNSLAPDAPVGINSDDRQSIELVCLSAKVQLGPAAYEKCRSEQMASNEGPPGAPGFYGKLTPVEEGAPPPQQHYPAFFNHLPDAPEVPPAAPQGEPPAPSLDGLTGGERRSLELVCLSAKVQLGPTAYEKCRRQQVAALKAGPRGPSLAGLSLDDRQSLDMACLTDQVQNGPAAYDRCLQRQVAELRAYRSGQAQ